MRVLIDSNLTPHWVEFLKSVDIDAVHWWSVGKGDAPDAELLDWAIEQDAAILTSDCDFSQMLALRKLLRPSVIYLRTAERNPIGPGERVIAACKTIAAESNNGLIVTIDDRGSRQRALPIQSNE